MGHGFKEQLLAGMAQRRWELIEVDEEGVDWWADEHWRVRSLGEACRFPVRG